MMKSFTYYSSSGNPRGTFECSHIDQEGELVVLFDKMELVGVVRLAEGESIGPSEKKGKD